MTNMFSIPNWIPRDQLTQAQFVPDVVHDGQITSMGLTYSKNKGTPLYEVKMKIWPPGSPDSKNYTAEIYLVEGQMWRPAQFFEAVGATKMWDENMVDFDTMPNRTFRVIFKTEEYNGEKKSKVKKFLKRDEPASSSPPVSAPFQDDDIPWG